MTNENKARVVKSESRPSYEKVDLVFPWAPTNGSVTIPNMNYIGTPFDGFYERLVACWNACEGVPTEVLEASQADRVRLSVDDQARGKQ